MVRVAQCECPECHWTVQLNIVKIVCFILCDFYHNKKKHILKGMSPRSVTPAAMEEEGTEVGSGEEVATGGSSPSWGVCRGGRDSQRACKGPALTHHGRPSLEHPPPLRENRLPSSWRDSKSPCREDGNLTLECQVRQMSPWCHPPTTHPHLSSGRRDSHRETSRDCSHRCTGREGRRATAGIGERHYKINQAEAQFWSETANNQREMKNCIIWPEGHQGSCSHGASERTI